MAGAKALGEKAGSLPTMGRNAGGNKLQAKKKDIWITANTTHRHRRMCLCRCRCTVGVGVRVCVCACVREGRLAVCSPSAICDQWTIKREIRSGGENHNSRTSNDFQIGLGQKPEHTRCILSRRSHARLPLSEWLCFVYGGRHVSFALAWASRARSPLPRASGGLRT